MQSGGSESLFSGTQYDGQVFEDVALSRAEIVSRKFYGCEFVDCAFAETAFEECRFVDCTFRNCDLSLVRVAGCSFNDARFEDSKVIGVNWTAASWPRSGLLNPVVFLRCILNHSTFIGLNLRGTTIKECSACDVDFREANLTEADLTDTDLSGSLFVDTDLTRADFTGALNYNVNANVNVLKQTKFSLPEAMSLLHSLDIVLVE